MRALAVLVVALAGLVLVPSPASAADELELSRDGVAFAGTLAGTLFDEDVRWVPGDERSATFFVRNATTADAALDVRFPTGVTGTLISDGWISVQVSAPGTARIAVREIGHVPAPASIPVAAGRTVPVEVAVRFDPAAPNPTQLLSADLDLDVVLSRTDVDGGAGEAPGGESGTGPGRGDGNGNGAGSAGNGSAGAGLSSSSLLPATGAWVAPWLLTLAVLLMTVGLALGRPARTPLGDPHD